MLLAGAMTDGFLTHSGNLVSHLLSDRGCFCLVCLCAFWKPSSAADICWSPVNLVGRSAGWRIKAPHVVEKCPPCHDVTHRIGRVTHVSEPCPQKAIGALLMTSQRGWKQTGEAKRRLLAGLRNEAVHLGFWTAGMSRWTPLFPLIFMVSGTPDWTFESRFSPLWPAGVELALSLWKCWCKNRQRYNHKCRKTRIYSSFVFLTRRWHPPEGNI